MSHAAAFILQKYIVLKTLKKSDLGTTELVLGRDQKVYVRKCLHNAAYPVEAVRGLKHKKYPILFMQCQLRIRHISLRNILRGRPWTLCSEKRAVWMKRVL